MSNEQAMPGALEALARQALEAGTKQLEAVGTPLNPFFLDETGKAYFLFDNVGGVDPMTMALAAIQANAPGIRRCALLVDTRIGFNDGKKWDALVAMVCDRDEDEGIVLAQRYVPKGWFRKFRLEGEIEQVAKTKNFIRFAIEQQDEDIERGAASILKQIEAVYVPSHDYRKVSPAEFPHLDLDFYADVLRELEGAGFSHLADVEDQTISNAPGSLLERIMIRSMLSADGSISASAYDPKLTDAGLAMVGNYLAPVVDFETEFDDGSFVVTSNAASASSMALPPIIQTEYLPAGTPLAEVMAAHRERVAAYGELTGLEARTIADHDDHIRAQNRLNALKSAFRNELGGISAAELEALSSGRLDIAARMHAKVRALRAAAS